MCHRRQNSAMEREKKGVRKFSIREKPMARAVPRAMSE